MATSARLASAPPVPVRTTERRPAPRACLTARTTLGELPLVLIPIKTSPGRPRAWTCRSNTPSNPQSSGRSRPWVVPATTQGLDLPLEYAVEPAIVGKGGQEGGVGGQCDGRQPWTLEALRQSTHELGGHVLAIGGASAVSAKQHLAAAAEGLGDEIRRRDDGLIARLGASSLGVGAFAKICAYCFSTLSQHSRFSFRFAGAVSVMLALRRSGLDEVWSRSLCRCGGDA